MAYKNLTSQQEADILREFERSGVGRLKDEIKENFFTEVSQEVIDGFRQVVEDETGNTSGNLKSSIIAIPTPQGFEIEGAFYFKFVDEGVNAAPRVGGLSYKKRRVTGAPYSFNNLGVGNNFASSIRQNYGVSMSDAYGIATGIKKYGIEAKDLIGKVINETFLDEIAEDISTILGLAVEVTFDKATEQ